MGFHSLEIGKSALYAANYGLQVTGQNLANVNTSGYSRKVVDQYGVSNSSAGTTLLGSGVGVRTVSRVVDLYAEKQLRQTTSSNSYYCSLDIR